jgi:hypothetical protein
LFIHPLLLARRAELVYSILNACFVLLTGNKYTKSEKRLALLGRLYLKESESTEAKEIIARKFL